MTELTVGMKSDFEWTGVIEKIRLANGRPCQSLPRTAQYNVYPSRTDSIPSSGFYFICSFVNIAVSSV